MKNNRLVERHDTVVFGLSLANEAFLIWDIKQDGGSRWQNSGLVLRPGFLGGNRYGVAGGADERHDLVWLSNSLYLGANKCCTPWALRNHPKPVQLIFSLKNIRQSTGCDLGPVEPVAAEGINKELKDGSMNLAFKQMSPQLYR